MIIRLGYACISETINVTSSSTYTYTRFKEERDFSKLDLIIKSNLNDLEKILNYNSRNNIHFYRLSSNLIPLATKKEVEFDYIDKYKDYYDKLSNMIRDFNMRVDFHPSEYCVLNSVKSDVIQNSIDILVYHYNLLRALKIKEKVLVLHIGSNAFGKDNSLSRFINNFKELDKCVRECIVIENDDKIFNIEDCLYISEKLNIPVVLDYHHYLCNKIENIDDYLDRIINSWKGEMVKMHFSSPKSKRKSEFRSHNDYIDVDSFIEFIEVLKKYNVDIDIMIEAKKKDEAMFRLVRELKYKTAYKFIDETSFMV